MRSIIFAIFFFSIPISFAADNLVLVSGTVTNYLGAPIKGADIVFEDFKNGQYIPAFSTKSDSNGKFKISIEDRRYDAVFIAKDHGKSFLEFWYWDYQPNTVSELNIFIDGLEVYGMKSWVDNGTGGRLIYVRPMSLKKFKDFASSGKPQIGDIDIAPDLKLENVRAYVNGSELKVWGINRVKETVKPDGTTLVAYLMTIPNSILQPYEICLNISDPVTSELGFGCIGL